MGANLPRRSGHGIVRVGHNYRLHVTRPQLWAESVATDYWANWMGHAGLIEAGVLDLDQFGWSETAGFSQLVGAAAGMMDASDVGTTGGINFDVGDDFIISPFIFGDYAHAKMVEGILGYVPTELSMECYARFAASSADEQATGFGFVEAGATGTLVKGDTNGFITIGATNFELHTGAAADEGSAKNTTAHLFKITFTAGSTAEWFIDETSQGTLAIQANVWPAAWAGQTANAGVNDPVIAWTHIWYS